MTVKSNRNMKKKLKPGLSGIMRVWNEERMIEQCIDSVIDALDELIVVCFDCTDSTVDILARKAIEYPEKLRYFVYPEKVYSFNLTEKEYEEALRLPEDSPKLYCNVCNFGIEKARFSHIVKIDTDQLYFSDRIHYWKNVCKGEYNCQNGLQRIKARFFKNYISLYRVLSNKVGRVLSFMMPGCFVKLFSDSYTDYISEMLYEGKMSVAWSGINVVKDNGRWFVTCDTENIHPPYNGEGDTVIFPNNGKYYFGRLHSDRGQFSVTEGLISNLEIGFTAPVWFHLHANRHQCHEKVIITKRNHPEMFIPLEQFQNYSYKHLLDMSSNNVPNLFQKILFGVIHQLGNKNFLKYKNLLYDYNEKV